jgi:hypothetical protein
VAWLELELELLELLPELELELELLPVDSDGELVELLPEEVEELVEELLVELAVEEECVLAYAAAAMPTVPITLMAARPPVTVAMRRRPRSRPGS